MSAGHARAAIREMLRFPRPGRRWSRAWTGVGLIGLGLLGIAVVHGPFSPLGTLAGTVGGALAIAVVAKVAGRLWTWLLVTLVLGLGLGVVPLFGVLGFELAIPTALLAAVMGLDLGSALARVLQRMPAPGISRASYAGRTLARSCLAASLLVAALLMIPAVIAAIRGLWLPTCDWWFGLEAYLVMPIATGVLAGATGHALGVLIGPRRYLGALIAQLPAVMVAIGALWRFYSAPPVFTYNAVLGYFPGNLYDENVKLTSALLWSRLEQLAWVVALIALIATRFDVPRFRFTRQPRPAGRRWGALAIAGVSIAAALALHAQSGRLGYTIDAEDIQDALGGRLETPHFIIHYTQTDELEEVIGLVAADHEFRYAQVVAQLGVEAPGKIRSFYFATRDEKARWMGARDVEMAKPWRREIYLEHRAFPHGSLRHEIAHAVASAFGDPLFGVAAQTVLGVPAFISPGLIEGLAVAVDWPAGYDRLTPHESVRALQAMGKQPTIRSLLSLQFFAVSSATGYTTAGSFLRFLLDRYGAPSLRALYGSGGDFAAAYGKPLAVLEDEWRAMIATIEVPAAAIEASRERFRVASVFSRPCPHAIAARRERALAALIRGDRPRAIDLMRAVCSDAPEEPRYRLSLGDLLAGGAPHERTEAARLWTEIATDLARVTSTIRAEAYERLARAAAARDDFAEVRRLIGQALPLAVDPDARRQLDAFALALAHAGPAGPALRGYFFGSVPGIDPPTWALLATLAEPRLGFAHYLLGLQRVSRGDLALATPALERGLALGLPSIAFVKNAARRLAVSAYRTGDTIRLSSAITVLSGAAMTASDRLLAADWLARTSFDATGALPRRE